LLRRGNAVGVRREPVQPQPQPQVRAARISGSAAGSETRETLHRCVASVREGRLHHAYASEVLAAIAM